MWLSWIPSTVGYLKLKFDGASKGNPGKAGLGYVVGDHNQNVIQATCGLWGFVMPPKLKLLAF